MAFRIKPSVRLRKSKTAAQKEILRRLDSFLNENSDEPAEILVRFWEDQRNAITYKELREAVQNGDLNQQQFEDLQKDYSVLVAEKFAPIWEKALAAGPTGHPLFDDRSFSFDTQAPGIVNWIQERGASFVTNSTDEQIQAIRSLLEKKIVDEHTVDELSRLIRPCIGLTKGDTQATLKLYDSVKEKLKAEHPRMKPESIRKKALDTAQKYAEQKHRARAFLIAQTELEFAYNRGADLGIRQAQEAGLVGLTRKRWITSGDDAVCLVCAALDGTEIEMDGTFDFKGKVLFQGQKMLPPAHPRCACAVEYIEVEPPVFTEPQTQEDLEENDQGLENIVDEDTGYKEMSNDEYLEWQEANSTNQKVLEKFEEDYGVKLNENGMLPFTDDRFVESEGEWLEDILSMRKDDLFQVQNRLGHCGYIQDSDGSKAINAYLRRGEVEIYRKGEMEKTIDSMKRLIDTTVIDENITVDRWAGVDALERMGIEVGEHGATKRIGHAFATDELDYDTILSNVESDMVGKEITDKGFMSASVCSSANVFQGSDIKFKIQVPAGTNAFVSENTVESEVVFAPGTKQEVLGVRLIETEAKNWDDERITRQSIEILVRIIGG